MDGESEGGDCDKVRHAGRRMRWTGRRVNRLMEQRMQHGDPSMHMTTLTR